MPNARIVSGDHAIEAVQANHIESIRVWRNAQIDVLRQSAPIAEDEQVRYFNERIWNELYSAHPTNLLVSLFYKEELIGYGGLVHIAWPHRRAEVSFLLNNDLAGRPSETEVHFPAFLRLAKTLAFKELGLQRLVTETYAIRSAHIRALEAEGFRREGVLRDHVLIQGQPVDSLMHGCLAKFGGSAPGGVLVSSAGAKISMVEAVRIAAQRLPQPTCVVAGDVDSEAPTRFVSDAFWVMPPTTPDNLQEILNGCRARAIQTVIPSRDGELSFWAEQREAFTREGIDVVVSPLESVRTCTDKLAFAEFGKRNGLPFIPAADRIDDLGTNTFVVKERFGAGSRSIGIGLDRASALEHARTLNSPIFQPLVTGTEISIDAWVARDHRVKGVVLRTRDRVVDGESKDTSTFHDKALEEQAAHILEALKLRGPVVMQAFLDSDGKLQVIECNARFGGASTTSIAAGLDALAWSLLESRGIDVSDVSFQRELGTVRQIRVQRDILVHDSGF